MLLDKNIIQNSKYPVATFKEMLNMQRGRFGHRPRNDPRYYGGEIPFIQTGNVVKASESNEKIEYNQTLNELGLSTSRLFESRVLVITIAANIGYTAILDYPACFPDSLVALTLKTEGDLSLEYVNVYIRMIRQYIENLAPQAAQKNINLKQLRKMPIIIPDKDTRKEIVSIMEAAYDEKIKKEQKAESLQKCLDSYLLQALDIEVHVEKKQDVEQRIFYLSESDLWGNRFDPEYHKPVFAENLKNIEQGKYRTITLKKIAKGGLIKGSLPHDNQRAGECKVIQISNINTDGTIEVSENTTSKSIYSPEQKLKKGDILVVITGATIGKIGFWDYEGEYYLGGDIVKFNTGNYFLNEIYAALLRTKPYQLQIRRCITGATNGHLSLKDLELLQLPYIMHEDVQENLTKYISANRSKIRLLKQDAKTVICDAKKQIEKMLWEKHL